MPNSRFLLISVLFLAGCGQPVATGTSQPLPPGTAAAHWADVVYEIPSDDVGGAYGSGCFDRWGGNGRAYRQCRLAFDAGDVLRFEIGNDPWQYGYGCQTGYAEDTLAAFDVWEIGGREIPLSMAVRPDGRGCEFQAPWSTPRGSWGLCDFIGGCR